MANKTVSFVDDNDLQLGICDITDAAFETLAGDDVLISYGGQLWGYHDSTSDVVEMRPRWPHLLFSIGEPGAPAVVVPADPSGDVARLAAVSDLFFNYEHPARNALVAKVGTPTIDIIERVGAEAYREAIAKDAQDFVNTFAIATGITIKVDDLVRDYLDRE